MATVTGAMIDVVALEVELRKVAAHPEWGQGPGTDYYAQVERELAEARKVAGLPFLSHTYQGIGYVMPDRPPLDHWFERVRLSGSFHVERTLGDGREAVGVVLDNGEGGRWLATELGNLEKVPDPDDEERRVELEHYAREKLDPEEQAGV